MGKYAKDTSVSIERSKSEIERVLMKYGADEFMSATRPGEAVVQFQVQGRRIRFRLLMPALEDFRLTPVEENERSDAQTHKFWEQGCRQCWRALLLTIKAKLESIESGIEEFDEAFMAQIVLPNGKTVGEALVSQIALSYENETMPSLLPAPTPL